MLEIPVFLYTFLYIAIASIIPLLILSRVLRMFVKSGKKLIRSIIA